MLHGGLLSEKTSVCIVFKLESTRVACRVIKCENTHVQSYLIRKHACAGI